MTPEELRTKLTGWIDEGLSHTWLVTGDKRAVLIGLKGYVHDMDEPQLVKLQSYLPTKLFTQGAEMAETMTDYPSFSIEDVTAVIGLFRGASSIAHGVHGAYNILGAGLKQLLPDSGPPIKLEQVKLPAVLPTGEEAAKLLEKLLPEPGGTMKFFLLDILVVAVVANVVNNWINNHPIQPAA